jgi:hypothetical protein
MKSISGKLFNAKVSIERVKDDGLAKQTKEDYVVKAVNFTDCEAKLTKELAEAENVKKTFDILAEAIAPFREVYVFDEGEIYYKVKITENWLDDYGNDKKTNTNYLVNAGSLEQARKNIVEALGNSMNDYTVAAVIETKILDVIE